MVHALLVLAADGAEPGKTAFYIVGGLPRRVGGRPRRSIGISRARSSPARPRGRAA